ncbi:N-acetylmuramoyl-L-alanine amidase [Corynebacterium diphtheriae]|uniref:N-acetylmuramoyl-L-alanine amidase n=1 Tax=Corynebacterium diphtheriae TaxID=1717 RepID=UPI00064C9386|nr:N-acetylmuramoyl-L-alanine amidase [Corynebacterium diphtheriae]OWN09043.1 N-acetylmuramoyl-L-alanine amidase [Corynebacterium belfantii]MBG9264575.1 N-acetylmuramoyl-L-alanine amidase [Corynebacterium diphtheriae bv. gravis]OWM46799.1 N-acetylmuramoyl-L-alanine amidase [Corynebacterium diphtheriae]OWM50500.1 N-acetylmuramoyl-L-alanine amidase [Corynebacterium diphtheriae]OWM98076.1 N-acetylmuramoyl-L-alanine amidase [Corynebacterium diphtheriae bv. mitis]
MQQRRRLISRTPKPVTAAIMAITLVGAAAVGVSTHTVLFTQGDAIAPINPELTTSSLADGNNVLVTDPAIATQGEGEGPKTVKEFHREQPFSQFALTWNGERDIAAFVRGQRPDGTWTEWFDTEPLDYGSDNPNHKKGTDLIYIEPTTTVQVSISGVDVLGPDAANLDAVFIDGGTSDLPENGINLTADSDGMPRVISRAGWGADESLRCSGPEYEDSTAAIVIHHTAGSNNYSQKESPGIMRGIYKYHAQTLGWCDIGYHALADKYGNLFEGRYGGLNKSIVGAHAGGFNSNTWAISMMGNYDVVQPPQAMIKSVGELAGWRAKVAGIDPKGYDTHYSEGSSYTFYPYGQAVRLPNIFAHRDVGNTACPGRYGYAQMDNIRNIAKQKYDSIRSGSGTKAPAAPSTPANPAPAPAAPSAPAAPAGTNPIAQLSQGSTPANTGSLVGLAVAAATSLGLIGNLNNIGDVPVIGGLKLSQLQPIIGKIVELLGNNDVSRVWRDVNSFAGAALGNARSPIAHYASATGTPIDYALFDNGIVISNPETGTNALWGTIGDLWAQQGFEAGPLGLPTSSVFEVDGLQRVNFQHGYITFNPTTSAIDIQVQ